MSTQWTTPTKWSTYSELKPGDTVKIFDPEYTSGVLTHVEAVVTENNCPDGDLTIKYNGKEYSYEKESFETHRKSSK